MKKGIRKKKSVLSVMVRLVASFLLFAVISGVWFWNDRIDKQTVSLLEKDTPDIAEEWPETTDSRDIISAPDMASVPEYMIQNFPILYQNPELPTGCEITALTMMLHFYGYHISKVEMAESYLPVLPRATWEGLDGTIYGPDMYDHFVGDPKTIYGIICGAGAIKIAADAYLTDAGSPLRAQNITGSPVSELYTYVSQGTPVFVCATIEMNDRKEISGSWYTEDGRKMEWARNDHGVVLIGYSTDKVVIGDPISGLITRDRKQFESVYEQRGRQAVILWKPQ